MQFSQKSIFNCTSSTNLSFKSLNASNSRIYQQSAIKNNYRKQIINVQQQNFMNYLTKLQWRKKTGFPVVKIINYKRINYTLDKISPQINQNITISLMMQPISFTLNQIDQVPMVKIIYLLRQTLIGCQRLNTIYGNFILNTKMIAINLLNKCKIWHNSSFYIDQPQFPCFTQKEVIKSIIQIFNFKTKCSSLMKNFFQQLQKCQNFTDCLKVVKKLSDTFKIRVPNSFVVSDIFSSNLCSPRKYISRPPSNQKNPQSPQKQQVVASYIKQKLQSFITPTKRSPQSQLKRMIQSVNFSKKNNQKKCYTQSIQYPKKQFKRSFPKYLQLDTKVQKQTKIINSAQTTKRDILSPFKGNQLLVIESVYEGDSQQIDDISYVLNYQKLDAIVIPRLSKNKGIQADLNYSQMQTVSSMQKQSDRDFKTHRVSINLRSTLDNTLILQRGKRSLNEF